LTIYSVSIGVTVSIFIANHLIVNSYKKTDDMKYIFFCLIYCLYG